MTTILITIAVCFVIGTIACVISYSAGNDKGYNTCLFNRSGDSDKAKAVGFKQGKQRGIRETKNRIRRMFEELEDE